MLDLINPKDATSILSLAEASEADVDAAVASASKAFKTGPWSKFSGEQRAACLNKLADLIDENAKEIANFESLCSGRPLSMVSAGDLPRVAAVFRCRSLSFLYLCLTVHHNQHCRKHVGIPPFRN